jgi:hypothetical protein
MNAKRTRVHQEEWPEVVELEAGNAHSGCCDSLLNESIISC